MFEKIEKLTLKVSGINCFVTLREVHKKGIITNNHNPDFLR